MHTLDELRAELRTRGLTARPVRPVLAALALHTLLLVAATAGYIAVDLPWYRAICIFVMAVACLGVGCHTHTAAHHAASDRRWHNTALTLFGYPFINGLAATWWAHKHHTIHHPAPNVVGFDNDIDLAPWFVLTEPDLARSRGLARVYYRLQWLVLAPALALNFLNFIGHGLAHAARQAVRGPKRGAAWLDLGLIAAHLLASFAVPAIWLGWSGALWLLLLRYAAVGVAMFVVFAPGHFPREAVCLAARPGPAEFARLQVAASANFTVGPVGRFVCGGLEKQIEHHLFPNLSPAHYDAASPLIREFCERQGWRYNESSWDRALVRAVSTFVYPKPVAADLDAASDLDRRSPRATLVPTAIEPLPPLGAAVPEG